MASSPFYVKNEFLKITLFSSTDTGTHFNKERSHVIQRFNGEYP